MRDRMADLNAGAPPPAAPPPGSGTTANSLPPASEKKSRAKDLDDANNAVAPSAPADGESDEMKAFFNDVSILLAENSLLFISCIYLSRLDGTLLQIEIIRSDIDTIKKTVGLIQQAHENALNVISESQSAETAKELERHMEKANQLSGSVRNKLKAMEAANKKVAKQTRSGDARIRITQHGAIAKKFLDVMMEYKDTQKKYQDKYKQRMQRQYLIVNPNADDGELEKMMDGEAGPVFAQSIVHSGQKAEAKRALKEIQERHADVQKIERSIIELQQLFVDMAVLVAAQGDLIKQIEDHVDNANQDVDKGATALHGAVKLQKKARKKMCIIIALIIALALVIGLGVYFGVVKK
ncbi:Plasma membrane t-SNARE, secretory vesicle fusion [Entophlyctis luteolus]|nr:Plasma membrane t-SNARE, secretory vesicle fusion [Entophlyctis luteolus]